MGAVVCTEIEAAAQYRQVFDVAGLGARADILHQRGARPCTVALPELTAIGAVVGAEVDTIAHCGQQRG